MPSRQCRCGKGYVSRHDGKCGHCRTRRERANLQRMFDPVRSVDWAARQHGFVNEDLLDD